MVVPTMAIMSSMTSLSLAPAGNCGVTKSRAICDSGGWTVMNTGTSSRLPATSDHRKALETAEIAGAGGGHDQDRRQSHAQISRNAEIIERQS